MVSRRGVLFSLKSPGCKWMMFFSLKHGANIKIQPRLHLIDILRIYIKDGRPINN